MVPYLHENPQNVQCHGQTLSNFDADLPIKVLLSNYIITDGCPTR